MNARQRRRKAAQRQHHIKTTKPMPAQPRPTFFLDAVAMSDRPFNELRKLGNRFGVSARTKAELLEALSQVPVPSCDGVPV